MTLTLPFVAFGVVVHKIMNLLSNLEVTGYKE